jgi:hypothetical protein
MKSSGPLRLVFYFKTVVNENQTVTYNADENLGVPEGAIFLINSPVEILFNQDGKYFQADVSTQAAEQALVVEPYDINNLSNAITFAPANSKWVLQEGDTILMQANSGVKFTENESKVEFQNKTNVRGSQSTEPSIKNPKDQLLILPETVLYFQHQTQLTLLTPSKIQFTTDTAILIPLPQSRYISVPFPQSAQLTFDPNDHLIFSPNSNIQFKTDSQVYFLLDTTIDTTIDTTTYTTIAPPHSPIHIPAGTTYQYSTLDTITFPQQTYLLFLTPTTLTSLSPSTITIIDLHQSDPQELTTHIDEGTVVAYLKGERVAFSAGARVTVKQDSVFKFDHASKVRVNRGRVARSVGAGVTVKYRINDQIEFSMESIVKIVISTSILYGKTTLVSVAFLEMVVAGT